MRQDDGMGLGRPCVHCRGNCAILNMVRLAANLPLVRNNLCPLSFVDVPTHAYLGSLLGIYERNQVELLLDVFCLAYERPCAR